MKFMKEYSPRNAVHDDMVITENDMMKDSTVRNQCGLHCVSFSEVKRYIQESGLLMDGLSLSRSTLDPEWSIRENELDIVF